MATHSRTYRTSKLALLSVLLALPIFTGSPFCSKDDSPPPVIVPPSRSTPEELLTNWFERAYINQDSILYEEMLDDAFRFEFLQEDADSLIARGILLFGETSWGKTSDLKSTGGLFRSDNVGDISLDLLIDSNTLYAGSELECANNACRLIQSTVTLRVTTRPNDPDPLILAVDSPQDFVVKRDPADTTLWVIFRQTDKPRT